jgi:hypothetical protein
VSIPSAEPTPSIAEPVAVPAELVAAPAASIASVADTTTDSQSLAEPGTCGNKRTTYTTERFYILHV